MSVAFCMYVDLQRIRRSIRSVSQTFCCHHELKQINTTNDLNDSGFIDSKAALPHININNNAHANKNVVELIERFKSARTNKLVPCIQHSDLHVNVNYYNSASKKTVWGPVIINKAKNVACIWVNEFSTAKIKLDPQLAAPHSPLRLSDSAMLPIYSVGAVNV